SDLERADSNSWWVNGKLHREDGPAIEYADGGKVWYKNNKLHRHDGPAVEYASGNKQWFVNDMRCRSASEFQQATNISDEQLSMLILKYGEIK
ncbi:hypothetical protein RZS08_34025, partial [Arthrospira platensis SPKY1]|nr:hypothetical protein [Arthrospira platensis SPKY1]